MQVTTVWVHAGRPTSFTINSCLFYLLQAGLEVYFFIFVIHTGIIVSFDEIFDLTAGVYFHFYKLSFKYSIVRTHS